MVGGGHALRNAGIPGLLPSPLGHEARIIIPEINGIDEGNVTLDLADYLLLEGGNPVLEMVMGN
jgi:hypothetical protein